MSDDTKRGAVILTVFVLLIAMLSVGQWKRDQLDAETARECIKAGRTWEWRACK